MKILITGGAGFIGSHITDALIAQGHTVAIIDNLSTGKKENIHLKARLFRVDIQSLQIGQLEGLFGPFPLADFGKHAVRAPNTVSHSGRRRPLLEP